MCRFSEKRRYEKKRRRVEALRNAKADAGGTDMGRCASSAESGDLSRRCAEDLNKKSRDDASRDHCFSGSKGEI